MNVDFPMIDLDAVVVDDLAIDLDSIFVVVAVRDTVVDNMNLIELVVEVVEMVLMIVQHEFQVHHSMLQSFDLSRQYQ
jgi:hypothetical protein